MKTEEDLEELGRAFERCGKDVGSDMAFEEDERRTLNRKLYSRKALTTKEAKWLWGFKFRAMGAIMQGDAAEVKRMRRLNESKTN